ncbi:MAG TPA: phosphatidylserine decarboxylase [Geopsychrobacteraceae bacterium]|nr:phosphatidylserine decarboxylase [Geopsychrobacteraceae bacterium]
MELTHQYIERFSGKVCNEPLFGDRLIRWLYHPVREKAPQLFQLLTGQCSSQLLGFFNYDLALASRIFGNQRFLREAGVDLEECLASLAELDTARRVFERKIHYELYRPMPEDEQAVVSPADARVIVGSLDEVSSLQIKGKFFAYEELLGRQNRQWLDAFRSGDFAIFRLTPDKYHYNHTPVAGKVVDYYEIDGSYHSCNPQAIVTEATPFSKNRRVVTVFDTDVPGGSSVGKVAMLEVVALMIGGIDQCYSRRCYDDPQPIRVGMFVEKGCPKSLYRPGSSTDVLLFEPGRVAFAGDLLNNRLRQDVSSRFSAGFKNPLVETDIRVRSLLATPDKQEYLFI